MAYSDDIQLARKLCNKEKDDITLRNAQGIIQDKMAHFFMCHAKKLAKRTYEYRSGWVYKSKREAKKVSVRITEDFPSLITRKKPAGVMDAYNWIVRSYIPKKCCFYDGRNHTSLKHYLNIILTKYALPAWLSHIYGDPNYVPVCIQRLDADCQNIFLRLRKVKNLERVKEELMDEIFDIDEKLLLIKRSLLKAGLIDLIMEFEINEIDENIARKQTIGDTDQSLNEFLGELGKQINKLPSIEKELLIYKHFYSYSVREIIKLFQSNNRMDELNQIGIINKRQVYKKIDKILNQIVCNVLNRDLNKIHNRKEVFKILYEQLERTLA